MRIWDLRPRKLCRQHLLGEHRELHALWAILTENKKGYRNHPETKRWIGKHRALYERHKKLVMEMSRRGYNHHSPLAKKFAKGHSKQRIFLDSPRKQISILRNKKCNCKI